MTATRTRMPAGQAVSTLGLQRKLRETEAKLHGAVELLAALVEKQGGTLEITAAETDGVAGKVMRFESIKGGVRLVLKEKKQDGNAYN